MASIKPPAAGRARAAAQVGKTGAGAPRVLSQVQVLKLPATALGADGRTPAITFDVPADTVGLIIEARGKDGVNYVVSNVTDASGRQLVTGGPAPSTGTTDALALDADERKSPNRSQLGESYGTAAVLIPNNPGVTPKFGKGWSVQVEGWKTANGKYRAADGPVQLTVTLKRAPKAPVAGRLNLHLFFSGSGGYTKATAEKSPLIRKMVEKVKATYQKAGIDIGTVTFDDLPSMPKRPADLTAMRGAFAKNKYADGIGVFFADEVLGSPIIAGASAGLPGPAVAASVTRSGVMMATSRAPLNFPAPEPGSDGLAHVLAHELGHYLGLFHTRDEFLGMDDPLGDTSNVPSNMMFATDPLGVVTFSKQQAAVMLRHPAVQVTKVAQR